MSQNISFTLTPDKLKKWFGGGDDNNDEEKRKKKDDDEMDTDINSNVDDTMIDGQHEQRKSRVVERLKPMTVCHMKFSPCPGH